VKDLEDWAAVQKVYKQTKSKRATAEILGISRNTVKKLDKRCLSVRPSKVVSYSGCESRRVR